MKIYLICVHGVLVKDIVGLFIKKIKNKKELFFVIVIYQA